MQRLAIPAIIPPKIAACVLAGGLSSRMGRHKDRVRLGQQTLLARSAQPALALGLPLRIIRRDLVARCGPLGGIYTGLKTSRADVELFLACDMPFISPGTLKALLATLAPDDQAVFVGHLDEAGFPCLLRTAALPLVQRQIQRGQFSLQALAAVLQANRFRLPRTRRQELVNVNTPADLALARKGAQQSLVKHGRGG